MQMSYKPENNNLIGDADSGNTQVKCKANNTQMNTANTLWQGADDPYTTSMQ